MRAGLGAGFSLKGRALQAGAQAPRFRWLGGRTGDTAGALVEVVEAAAWLGVLLALQQDLPS